MKSKRIKAYTLLVSLIYCSLANAQTSDPKIPEISVEEVCGLTDEYGVCGLDCGEIPGQVQCYYISWQSLGYLNSVCREIFFCGGNTNHGSDVPCPPWLPRPVIVAPPLEPRTSTNPQPTPVPTYEIPKSIPTILLPIDYNY